jgi:glutamine synthetase
MYLKNSGIADTAYFGAEAEFFIFDNVRFDQNQHSGFYFIDAEEGRWNSGPRGEQPRLPAALQGRLLPGPAHRSLSGPARRNGGNHDQLRPHIECHHHEVATGGQCEIDQRFDTLVKSADNMMLYKYIIRNVANQYGKTVTFMPKPLFGDNGSGMHTHQSLWKDSNRCLPATVRGFEPDGAVVHRRPAEACPRAVGDHRAHHQQLQAPGARL